MSSSMESSLQQQNVHSRDEFEEHSIILSDYLPPPSYDLREPVHRTFVCTGYHLELFKKHNLTLEGSIVKGRTKDKFKLVVEAVRENDIGLTVLLLQGVCLIQYIRSTLTNSYRYMSVIDAYKDRWLHKACFDTR